VELLGPEGSTVWPGGEPTRRHEVTVTGLEPGGRYRYRVRCRPPEGEETTVTSAYAFRAAPPAGQGPVTFAFAADSREGYGGNVQRYMGCNLASLERIAIDAYRRGAQLLLFGGDLVNGDTSDRSDFRLQLRGWKQACEGFWRTRPVYPAMGNHERLVNAYRDDSGALVLLDRWPYATESAEAVFAQEFHNPTNGPAPTDPRRPPYRENVYSFTFGPVRFIVFNNNYWWSLESCLPRWGGSPEGYVLDDQLRWIEAELERASAADEIRFVVLFAQEPAFPCGGHLHDAMWWNGDDRIRAYQRDGDEVVPAGPGIITVRNRLWRAVAACPKVAAVLAGDEHAYVRTLITGTTPVGDPEVDDTDGDGVLDGASPVATFRYPTWQIISGNAGAPYYHREPTPWAVETYSSQLGYCLFHAEGDRLSLTAWSLTGQQLDHVEDLLAVKR
jgi:3',5'-cyclic AMP phosphodiesterase CpdA